jgi:hypothetical protein
MPAHSSHILQPLDVGCFSPLKRVYGALIDKLVQLGNNHIDKLDFLDAYPTARQQAFKTDSIKSAFSATGLFRYDPQRVYMRLLASAATTNPTHPLSADLNNQFDALYTSKFLVLNLFREC